MKLLLRTAIAAICIVFINCEGRTTQSHALAEDIEEFNKKATIEVDVYKPEAYVEREVDTLLNNGYRVNIKTYSDMENTVLFTKIKDTINYQTHYRNYKFDILIEKDGKLIYNESFNKQRINQLLKFSTKTKSNDFEELGILKSINLNRNSPLLDVIKIDVMYEIPETDKRSLYTLVINAEGVLKVKKRSENDART